MRRVESQRNTPIWSQQRRAAPRDRCPRQIHRSTKGLLHAQRSIAIARRTPFRLDADIAGRQFRPRGRGLMAVCGWCNGEMTTALSCVVSTFHRNGRRFHMVPFGDEPGRTSRDQCGDCGVNRGGWHHPGCDLQQCPACGRQLISCGCWFDEDGPDEGLSLAEPLGVDGNGQLTERAWLGDQEVIIHREDIPETDVTTVHGIPCTNALRTVIDIAPDIESSHLEVIVQDCLERGLFTVEQASRRIAQPDMVGRRGAELLRRALPPP
jgi:hypothetical protein